MFAPEVECELINPSNVLGCLESSVLRIQRQQLLNWAGREIPLVIEKEKKLIPPLNLSQAYAMFLYFLYSFILFFFLKLLTL